MGKNYIFEEAFTFFENNRLLFVERRFEYKHISVRNKRFGKKKNGQHILAKMGTNRSKKGYPDFLTEILLEYFLRKKDIKNNFQPLRFA